MNKIQIKTIIIIINSIFLACGILMIIIPNIINSNWYSLLAIFLFGFSIIFPLLCNALNISGGYSSGDLFLMDDDDDANGNALENGKALSWFLTGLTVVFGYSIPFLLWANKEMPILNMSLSMGGGTIILISIGIFVRYILY